MSKCISCSKEKPDVASKFVGSEWQDPKLPFTKKQLIAKNLLLYGECYKNFETGKITFNIIKKPI